MRKTSARAVILFGVLTACGALAPGATQAQEARGGGAASARLLAELQQLSSERTSLQAENARLKQQLAAAQKEQGALKKGEQASSLRVKSGEAALARSNAQAASTQQQLARTQAAMQQLIVKFRDLAGTLRKAEIENATTRRTLAMQASDLRTCSQRNQALYSLDNQVLTHFERQGFFARLAQDEPFTQIKRTQLENFAIESREGADEHRYVPPAAATPRKP